MKPLHVLITNVTLRSRTGTELVVRDLALGLAARGHRPMVYSPELGDIAAEIAAAGVPVVSALDEVPHVPDLVHGHHHVPTVEALLHFPTARGLFVCHDRIAWTDVPPPLARVRRYVAVDRNCLERLQNHGVAAERCVIIGNAVDTQRFRPRGPLPAVPRRALVFSNYAGAGTYLEAVQQACQEAGLALDVIGSGSGRSSAAPEHLLGGYDVVFAKARCAIEAMAAGAAVILCDTRGLGPLVTADEVERLRAWNFGMRLLNGPLEADAILAQLRRYDPADAMRVRDHIRGHAALTSALDDYLVLYHDILAEQDGPTVPATGELGAYLRQLLPLLVGGVDDFERDAMHRLGAGAADGLQLNVTGPLDAIAGSRFIAHADLYNGSTERLLSASPFPVNIAYHWLRAESGEMVLFDGVRTSLKPSLAAGVRRVYPFAVDAPLQAGAYRLRATLVQEGVSWFDQLTPPLYADLPVQIG